MSQYDDALDKRNDDSTETELDKRTVRALTEVMSVLPDQPEVKGADEMFLVVSESGSEYTVDLRLGSCTCPDAQHRDPDGGCKHLRRCRIETGREPVPAWADRDAMDDGLGQHVETGPTMTDGGSMAVSEGQPQGTDDDESDDEDSECQCDDLPDGVPCWPCYRDGAAFERGDDE